mmetsp:Transcript_2849/g.7400  ORF Transcript_2849/g.7400 Transcript_2849/m.7400 type:complete len:260 (-) Transcript_2849:953-1732(-)
MGAGAGSARCRAGAGATALHRGRPGVGSCLCRHQIQARELLQLGTQPFRSGMLIVLRKGFAQFGHKFFERPSTRPQQIDQLQAQGVNEVGVAVGGVVNHACIIPFPHAQRAGASQLPARGHGGAEDPSRARSGAAVVSAGDVVLLQILHHVGLGPDRAGRADIAGVAELHEHIRHARLQAFVQGVVLHLEVQPGDQHQLLELTAGRRAGYELARSQRVGSLSGAVQDAPDRVVCVDARNAGGTRPSEQLGDRVVLVVGG